eukprot:1643378-Prymnesium_polylepis.1
MSAVEAATSSTISPDHPPSSWSLAFTLQRPRIRQHFSQARRFIHGGSPDCGGLSPRNVLLACISPLSS